MRYADEICVRPGPTLKSATSVRGHPLDVFERLCIADNLDYERTDTHEIQITLPGIWCAHDLSVIWQADKEQLNLYLVFENRSPSGRTDEMCRLLALLNERLSSGHFDFWKTKDTIVFRDTLNLSGGVRPKTEQAMALLAGALDASERGYPACQYLVWAGKSPEDALDTALLDLANYG